MNPHRAGALACLIAVIAVASVACSGADGDTGSAPDAATDGGPDGAPAADAAGTSADAPTVTKTLTYAPCSEDKHVGGFLITLAEKFTGVEGRVYDGVVPRDIPVVLQTEGTCRVMRLPSLLCLPGCKPGQTCKGEDGGGKGTCITHPVSHPVGTVTVTGLKEELSMTAKWGNNYINPGSLPHPAFDAGDAIALQATGGDYEAFSLVGQGVEALQKAAGGTQVAVDTGQPVQLKWQAPSAAGAADSPVRVHIALNLDNHGTSSGWIACDAPDTGSFTIPEKLVSALYGLGVSGFPTVTLTRRTIDSADITPGCVELVVASVLELSASIAGVTSCTDDKACPKGKTCGANLTCS